MQRFFAVVHDGKAVIDGEDYIHLTRSLRVKTGDRVALTDGVFCYDAVITSIDSEKAVLSAVRAEAEGIEPRRKITIIQGFPKGDKSEFITQKCTELGIFGIRFFMSDRSVVKLDEKQRKAKAERLSRVAASASEQSGRLVTPEVSIFPSLASALEGVSDGFLLYEKEREKGLKEAVGAFSGDFAFIIGAEGGISEKEAALCEEKGVFPVTLGRRILRTETAAVAVTAAVMCLLGELGP